MQGLDNDYAKTYTKIDLLTLLIITFSFFASNRPIYEGTGNIGNLDKTNKA